MSSDFTCSKVEQLAFALRMVPVTGTGRPQNGYGGQILISGFVVRVFFHTAIYIYIYIYISKCLRQTRHRAHLLCEVQCTSQLSIAYQIVVGTSWILRDESIIPFLTWPATRMFSLGGGCELCVQSVSLVIRCRSQSSELPVTIW